MFVPSKMPSKFYTKLTFSVSNVRFKYLIINTFLPNLKHFKYTSKKYKLKKYRSYYKMKYTSEVNKYLTIYYITNKWSFSKDNKIWWKKISLFFLEMHFGQQLIGYEMLSFLYVCLTQFRIVQKRRLHSSSWDRLNSLLVLNKTPSKFYTFSVSNAVFKYLIIETFMYIILFLKSWTVYYVWFISHAYMYIFFLRPGSVPTKSQVESVQGFAQFVVPMFIVFANV